MAYVKADYKKLKSDLIDQLERNGTVGEYYVNLVGDYMEFWQIKNELQSDIKTRGSKIEKRDSKGQPQIVNNESIEQIIKVNAQMLKILDSLGIKPVEAESTLNGGVDANEM